MSKKAPVFDPASNTTYRFCGNGAGIPGLPHEVTARQAEALGLLEVLQAAIQNGNYQPVQFIPADVAGKGE